MQKKSFTRFIFLHFIFILCLKQAKFELKITFAPNNKGTFHAKFRLI